MDDQIQMTLSLGFKVNGKYCIGTFVNIIRMSAFWQRVSF